jgi:hypothetical protein
MTRNGPMRPHATACNRACEHGSGYVTRPNRYETKERGAEGPSERRGPTGLSALLGRLLSSRDVFFSDERRRTAGTKNLGEAMHPHTHPSSLFEQPDAQFYANTLSGRHVGGQSARRKWNHEAGKRRL